jgi:hypothetical protein
MATNPPEVRSAVHQSREFFCRKFSYAHRVPARPALGRPEGPEEAHDDGLLVAHGPALAVTAFGGENYYAMAAGWMRSGRSNCVLTRALADGPVETWTVEGDQEDWATYFGRFLGLMPPGLAAAVRRLSLTLRVGVEG